MNIIIFLLLILPSLSYASSETTAVRKEFIILSDHEEAKRQAKRFHTRVYPIRNDRGLSLYMVRYQTKIEINAINLVDEGS